MVAAPGLSAWPARLLCSSCLELLGHSHGEGNGATGGSVIHLTIQPCLGRSKVGKVPASCSILVLWVTPGSQEHSKAGTPLIQTWAGI